MSVGGGGSGGGRKFSTRRIGGGVGVLSVAVVVVLEGVVCWRSWCLVFQESNRGWDGFLVLYLWFFLYRLFVWGPWVARSPGLDGGVGMPTLP